MYYIGNKYNFHREYHFAKITKNSPRTKQAPPLGEGDNQLFCIMQMGAEFEREWGEEYKIQRLVRRV